MPKSRMAWAMFCLAAVMVYVIAFATMGLRWLDVVRIGVLLVVCVAVFISRGTPKRPNG